MINSRDTRPDLMLTCGRPYFTEDTKAPTSAKRSVTHQTVTKAPSSLLSPEHGLLPRGLHGIRVPPFLYQFLPGLNGLCGWSINSVIQGVDSCSRVNVCSQPCRRDGPRPAALCLPRSLNRLEVNGGPCAEVAGAWMEPPLTWRSHRGRTGPDHCDTC